MKQYDKLIFIDADDTARAVMAAAIMGTKEVLGDLRVLSRGITVLFPEPVNQKAEAILASHGLSQEHHEAKQLQQEDFDSGTLLLVMEENQKNSVLASYHNIPDLFTLRGFIGDAGDVAPLFGEDLQTYGKCFDMLNVLIDRLADRLNTEVLHA